MTVHSAASPGARDKRERILDAAETLFARHGFFAAKVSEVAKEAGVADGTIYLYFKSKDDLLISLFERRMRQLNTALKDAIAGKPPRDQLRAFIHTYAQLVHDEPAATEVLTIELRQSSKFMKEYDNPEFVDFLRTLGGLIAAMQEGGELDPTIPPHVAARMIFGMLDELALAWVLSRAPATAPDARTRAASIGGSSPGTRPKKFDIVRAADWIISLVETGLVRKKESA
jgi:TetR/AcrR family transcriptional regulator, fatty acid metabolism regulator protein